MSTAMGRQRQVWLIPIADERVGVQVKLWNPLRTRAMSERFCSGDSLRRGAISSVWTFKCSCRLTSNNIFRHWVFRQLKECWLRNGMTLPAGRTRKERNAKTPGINSWRCGVTVITCRAACQPRNTQSHSNKTSFGASWHLPDDSDT